MTYLSCPHNPKTSMASLISAKYSFKGIASFQEQADGFAHRKKILLTKGEKGEKYAVSAN